MSDYDADDDDDDDDDDYQPSEESVQSLYEQEYDSEASVSSASQPSSTGSIVLRFVLKQELSQPSIVIFDHLISLATSLYLCIFATHPFCISVPTRRTCKCQRFSTSAKSSYTLVGLSSSQKN